MGQRLSHPLCDSKRMVTRQANGISTETHSAEAIHALNEWFAASDLLFMQNGGSFEILSEKLTCYVWLQSEERGKLIVMLTFKLKIPLTDYYLAKIYRRTARCSPSRTAVVVRQRSTTLFSTAYSELVGFSLQQFRDTFCGLADVCFGVLESFPASVRGLQYPDLR